MVIIPANDTYNLEIIFLVFRDLVNVLNNCCFYIEHMFLVIIFCMKTVIIYIMHGM